MPGAAPVGAAAGRATARRDAPGTDGLKLFERVRADDRFSGVSVVFLTGRDRTGLPDAASHVAKPFSPTDLLERVEQLG